MILRLVIADGSRIPAVAESVEVADDGAISGWRSVSAGGVGWFAGHLPAAEVDTLQALVAAVGAAPVVQALPGSGQEVLELEATGPVSIAGLRDDPAPWPSLAEAARTLIDRLTDFPRAAIAASLVGPDVARLVHLGTDPIRVDLSLAGVRTTAWRGYYEPAGTWNGVADGPSEVLAEPGWSFHIPVQPAATDTVVHLAVDFAVLHESTRVPVRASYTPAIASPE